MFNQLKMNLWILVIEFINLEKIYTMKYLFVFLLVGLYSCGNSQAIDVIGQEERKEQEKLEKQKKLEEEFKKNPKGSSKGGDKT